MCALHIGYPRFRGSISLEALGFNTDADTKKCLASVSQRLLADAMSEIQKSERQARAEFTALTFSVNTGVNIRFCPAKGLPGLLEKMDIIRSRFTGSVEEFLTNFTGHCESAGALWETVVNQQEAVPEEQKQAILAEIHRQLSCPPPDKNAFHMDLNWYELKGLSEKPAFADMQPDQVKEATEAWERVRKETEQRTRAMASTFVATCRRELLERLRKFFSDLSSTVYEGKTINRRTVTRINEYLDTIQQLNFMSDRSVEQAISRFRSVFSDADGDALDRSISEEEQVGLVAASIRETVDFLEISFEGTHEAVADAEFKGLMDL